MPPINASYDRNAVVTIQGGGVYGFNLLGQLQAVLELGIQPVALAGTSAGAVVATLFWAGWVPSSIRDEFQRLADKPSGLTDLVGPFAAADQGFDFQGFLRWSLRLQGYFERAGRPFRSSRGGGNSIGRVALQHFMLLPAYTLAAPIYFSWGLQLVRDIRAINRLVSARGVFPGGAFEDTIDLLIRASPGLAGIDIAFPPATGGGRHLLTFGEIRGWVAANGLPPLPPLVLTATNLRSRRLELFDSTDPLCDDIPVARAARASAGFPFFFQPVDLGRTDRDDSYVDGGMICNFPAFVFAESFRQRLLSHIDYNAVATRPWVHIGLRLTDGERPHVAGELYAPEPFFKAVWALATGTARTDLEGRVADMLSRSVSVEMPFADTNGPGGVMDIEKLRGRTISTMFRRGRDFAKKCLTPLKFTLPDTEPVEAELASILRQAEAVFGGSAPRPTFRANVYVAEGPDLVPRYRANMGSLLDTDSDLRFGFDCGLTGLCFTRRRPVICNLEQFGALFDGTASPTEAALRVPELFGFNELQQGKVRKDRTWLLSVPILDPYASYPMELSPNPTVGTGGLHFRELLASRDGAVFGVLNLDANFNYAPAGDVPPDTDSQLEDARILALVGIVVSASLKLGTTLARKFASRP